MNVLKLTFLVLLAFLSNSLHAQSIGEQNRPSMSVIIVDTEGEIRPDYSQYDFKNSPLEQRAFIDLIVSMKLRDLGYSQEEIEDANDGSFDLNKFSDRMSNFLPTRKFGNDIIESIYEVDENFIWTTRKVKERATYSQTIRGAQAQINTNLGALNTAQTQDLIGVTRTYILVVVPIPSTTSKRTSIRAEETNYSFEPYSVLYKIGYETEEDVLTTIGNFYCPTNCFEKKNLFNEYTVPFNKIDQGKGGAKAVVSGKESNELSLLNDLITNSLDLVINTTPSLQLKAYIEDIGPVTSLIGVKEGVEKGRRYRVIRQSLDNNNDIVEERRGYVRANEVVDNQSNAVVIDSTTNKETIKEFPPSSFVQIHGKKINPRDVLVEDVDFGLLIRPYAAIGSYTSIGTDIAYRLPNTLNSYALITADFSGVGKKLTENFWRDVYGISVDDMRTVLTQIGIGYLQDVYVANGNFRFTPKISVVYNFAKFISEDPTNNLLIESLEPSLSTIGARGGVDFSIQFKPNIGLYAGIHYSYLPEAFEAEIGGETEIFESGYSDYFKNKGLQIGGGIRIGL